MENWAIYPLYIVYQIPKFVYQENTDVDYLFSIVRYTQKIKT